MKRKNKAQEQRELDQIATLAYAAILFAPEIKIFVNMFAELVEKEKTALQKKEESKENA